MSHEIIDLNDRVVTVRRLRAAAVLPKFFALATAGVGLLLLALDENIWTRTMLFAASTVLLVLLARAIERGAVWAVWSLAVLVGGLTVLTFVSGG